MTKMQPVVYTLLEPVTITDGGGERTIAEVTFPRKMKGKDLAKQDQVEGKMMMTFALYASMCDEPIQLFTEMDTEDFTEIALKVAPLMGKRGAKMAEAEMRKMEKMEAAGE